MSAYDLWKEQQNTYYDDGSGERPVKGEVGRCYCGASYYRIEDIGQPCEIQYCRGTVRASSNDTEGKSRGS